MKQRIDNIFNALELQIEIPPDMTGAFEHADGDESDGSLEALFWKYPSPVDPKLTQRSSDGSDLEVEVDRTGAPAGVAFLNRNVERNESEYEPSLDTDGVTELEESSELDDFEEREPLTIVGFGSRSENLSAASLDHKYPRARRLEPIVQEVDYEADDEQEDEVQNTQRATRVPCSGGKTKPPVIELPGLSPVVEGDEAV